MLIGVLFKSFRVGLVLLYGAISAIFFEHDRYFIFCASLTLIQFLTFTAVGIINPKLLYSILITETLSGFNFFDILFAYVPFSVTITKIGKICLDALILINNLFLGYLVSCAVIHYTWLRHTGNATARFAFKYACTKLNLLFHLAVLETCVIFFMALIGAWGNLFYFIWQMIMVFAIQIITFQDIKISAVVKKSAHFFFKNVKNILGVGTVLNFVIITAAILLYYFYSRAIFAPIKDITNYSYLGIFIILYLLSVLYMIQIITFTNFYSIITKKKALHNLVKVGSKKP